MKISLLFPPEVSLVSPCLSLPSLTAMLRQHGHTVIQRDLNIEAHDTLLIPSRLHRAGQVLDCKLADIDRQARLSDRDRRRWKLLAQANLTVPYAAEHIGKARALMHDDVAFYDLDRYLWASRVIRYALQILNAEFEPYVFPLQPDFSDVYASWTVPELLSAAHDETRNAFLPYLRDQATPSILAECPDLVGISIIYHTQILHGLTLARLLREAQPNLPIYLGGAILSELADVLMQSEVLFELVNGFVVGEGETALLSLVEVHENNDSLAQVPNLVYADQTGRVRCDNLGFFEDLAALPTPDYAGLPLDDYLSPRRLGYLSASRGCYWNRCAFCTSPNALGRNAYRRRPLKQVAQDMLRLRARHGMELFFFCDDCFTPHGMARLADLLSATQVPVQWVAETRLDKRLTPELCARLAQGGCRHLIFGLESASQRVLDMMDKGIKIDAVPQVLRNCYAAGIGAVLMTFVNFPAETAEEAQTTVDFINKVSPLISLATLGDFIFMKGSPIDVSPSRFHIRSVHRPAANKLAYGYRYELQDGTTAGEPDHIFLAASDQVDDLFFHERRLFHSVHLFLHTTYRGTLKLGVPRRGPKHPSSLLNFVPCLPDSVCQHRFRTGDASLYIAFDQDEGRMWHLTERQCELLAACNGETPVKDIVEHLSNQSTGAARVRQWFRDLTHLRDLVAKGVLLNGYQDRVAVPPRRGLLPVLFELTDADGVSQAHEGLDLAR